MGMMANHLKTTLFLTVNAGLALSASAQEHELSLYGGIQDAPHSTVSIHDGAGNKYKFTPDWRGDSFKSPPYYGLRYTHWVNDHWGVGAEYNHAKVYSDRDTLRENGFGRLELTDGINIFTVNGMYRFDPVNSIEPYLGAGVGFSYPRVEVSTPSMVENEFEYQEYQWGGPAITMMGGVSYDITDNLSIFGEYKFNYTVIDTELPDNGSLETDIVTNAINLGISLNF